MHTYRFRVDPTDLRLELCEAHKQNYVESPLITLFPRFRNFRCTRGVGDVGIDMTQRLKLVCLALSALHEVPGETKHSTWLIILPLGGGQIPRVFNESRSGVLRW